MIDFARWPSLHRWFPSSSDPVTVAKINAIYVELGMSTRASLNDHINQHFDRIEHHVLDKATKLTS